MSKRFSFFILGGALLSFGLGCSLQSPEPQAALSLAVRGGEGLERGFGGRFLVSGSTEARIVITPQGRSVTLVDKTFPLVEIDGIIQGEISIDNLPAKTPLVVEVSARDGDGLVWTEGRAEVALAPFEVTPVSLILFPRDSVTTRLAYYRTITVASPRTPVHFLQLDFPVDYTVQLEYSGNGAPEFSGRFTDGTVPEITGSGPWILSGKKGQSLYLETTSLASGDTFYVSGQVNGVFVNKRELEVEIEDSQTLYNSVPQGTRFRQATAAVKGAFQTVITASLTLLDSFTASQSQVDAQIGSLTTAQGNFSASLVPFQVTSPSVVTVPTLSSFPLVDVEEDGAGLFYTVDGSGGNLRAWTIDGASGKMAFVQGWGRAFGTPNWPSLASLKFVEAQGSYIALGFEGSGQTKVKLSSDYGRSWTDLVVSGLNSISALLDLSISNGSYITIVSSNMSNQQVSSCALSMVENETSWRILVNASLTGEFPTELESVTMVSADTDSMGKVFISANNINNSNVHVVTFDGTAWGQSVVVDTGSKAKFLRCDVDGFPLVFADDGAVYYGEGAWVLHDLNPSEETEVLHVALSGPHVYASTGSTVAKLSAAGGSVNPAGSLSNGSWLGHLTTYDPQVAAGNSSTVLIGLDVSVRGLYSTNGGSVWTQIQPVLPLGIRGEEVVAMDVGSPDPVYVAAESGAFKFRVMTSANGYAGTVVPIAPSTAQVSDVLEAGGDLLLSLTAGGMFKSSDRGISWSQVNLPGLPSTIYDLFVYEYEESGTTVRDILLSCGSEGVVRVRKEGGTYVIKGNIPVPPGTEIRTSAVGKNGTLWCGTYPGAVYYAPYGSTVSWGPYTSTVYEVSALAESNGTLAVGLNGGAGQVNFILTDTGFDSFQEITSSLGSTMDVAVSPLGGILLAAGVSSEALRFYSGATGAGTLAPLPDVNTWYYSLSLCQNRVLAGCDNGLVIYSHNDY